MIFEKYMPHDDFDSIIVFSGVFTSSTVENYYCSHQKFNYSNKFLWKHRSINALRLFGHPVHCKIKTVGDNGLIFTLRLGLGWDFELDASEWFEWYAHG